MMTRKELLAALVPIVTDMTLTKDERGRLLSAVAVLWIEHTEPDALKERFNEWNLVMVELVDEYGLRRH